MSPLLFFVCMEYLTRTLKMVGENPLFMFHPRCTEVKLSHLYFVNDMILFCKGDFRSFYLIMQGFKHFSNTFGLEVNESKCEIFTTRMQKEEKQRLLDRSGFKMGKLPFKYLGVVISYKRLSAKECMCLVEKMNVK